jgi:hypothetical protein
MARVIVMVGTKKGVFLLESDEQRSKWEVRGPFCETWPINHVNYEPSTRTIFAAGGSPWFGSAVWRTKDFGETWTHSSEGLTYGDDGPKLIQLWNITPSHGSIYVGAEPAGLFRSDDDGETFVHVEGLRNHPTRPEWQPGGGGLCLHTIVPHPTDPKQLYVAASSVGTFFTDNGGESWVTRNKGLQSNYMPEGTEPPDVGWCVHKMVMAPGNPDQLYQQNHYGVYRSSNGGSTWEWINEGLPSTFGFPIVVHPHDPNRIYVIPLNGDQKGRFMPDGQTAVWRSQNGGDAWEKLTGGLPAEAYLGVLRDAMAIDHLPTPGIYFGTTTGQLFVSADEGNSWSEVDAKLPPIYGVEVAVVND